MRIIYIALLLCMFGSSAHAQTTTITGLPGSVTIGTQDVIPLDQTSGSTVTTVKETAANIVSNVLTNTAINFSGFCGTLFPATACTYIFGWADPRNYGATCGANWNTNNGTQDDGPGIAAALATGYTVLIPYPGCKIASTVHYTANSQNISSLNTLLSYNEVNSGQPAANGSIFVPSSITGTSQNCGIDFNGYDQVALSNVNMHDASQSNGTTALCDSYSNGPSNGPRNNLTDFTHVENFSESNFGMAFGAPTNSSGVPIAQACNTATCMGGSFVQLDMQNFMFEHSYWGFRLNFSDARFNTFALSNLGVAIAGYSATTSVDPTPSFAPSAEFLNGRIEFVGNRNLANGAVYQDTGFWNFENIDTDHNSTADFAITANATVTSLSNFTSHCAAAFGGANAGYNAAIVLENGAHDVTLSNFHVLNCGATNPTYALASIGTVSNSSLVGMTGTGGTGVFSWGGTLTNSTVSAVGTPYIFTGQNVGIGLGTSAPAYPLTVAGLTGTNGIISTGTTFTVASGCGTVGSLTGGTTIGSFTAGATSCAPVINLPTAPHGWFCGAKDLTNPSNAFTQTANSTTSCTVSATVTNGDTILIDAKGY